MGERKEMSGGRKESRGGRKETRGERKETRGGRKEKDTPPPVHPLIYFKYMDSIQWIALFNRFQSGGGGRGARGGFSLVKIYR